MNTCQWCGEIIFDSYWSLDGSGVFCGQKCIQEYKEKTGYGRDEILERIQAEAAEVRDHLRRCEEERKAKSARDFGYNPRVDTYIGKNSDGRRFKFVVEADDYYNYVTSTSEIQKQRNLNWECENQTTEPGIRKNPEPNPHTWREISFVWLVDKPKAPEKIFDEAMAFLNAKQANKAVPMLEDLANKGYVKAQAQLGHCFCYSIGKIPLDFAKGVEWYRKAAEKGNDSAQYELGLCYNYGKGVPQDYAKAAEWYRKAAAQGHEFASDDLRALKETGKI